jgi:hypothetical protein
MREAPYIGDMWTFYSVNLQHNYVEFENRVGGEFSETMPPSPKDGLELSIILNAPFAVGFMKLIIHFYKWQNAPFRVSFLDMIILKLHRNKVNFSNHA